MYAYVGTADWKMAPYARREAVIDLIEAAVKAAVEKEPVMAAYHWGGPVYSRVMLVERSWRGVKVIDNDGSVWVEVEVDRRAVKMTAVNPVAAKFATAVYEEIEASRGERLYSGIAGLYEVPFDVMVLLV